LTARFTAAGQLDTSFAGNGARVDKLGTGATPQRAGAVAAQADGSTLVAGVAADAWMLARFGPNGLADGLFGAAGVTLRDPVPGAGPDEVYPDELPALPDGTGPAAIAISPPPGPIAIAPPPGPTAIAPPPGPIAIAPGGRIVVAGSVGVANDDGVPGEQIVVARFGSTGLPDPSFGRDGFSVLQLGFGGSIRHASSAARALSLEADGRILIAGRASARDGGDRAVVARLTAAGRLDPSFARQGRLIVQLGRTSARRVASSSLAALLRRPDGRLLAAGRATDVAGDDATLLAGFTAAGALDGSFGHGGSVVSQLGVAAVRTRPPASQARALALQPDGAAIVAGAATGGSTASRYGANGAWDCGYGARGRAPSFGATGFDPAVDGAYGIALQPDGSAIVAGRRARGGLLLGRLLGGPPAAGPAAKARVVTLAARYAGRGRGYAYGQVEGGCEAVAARFLLTRPHGRMVLTKLRLIPGRAGPQVICAPLTNLRPGVRYRIRISSPAGGPQGNEVVLRAVKPAGKALAQEGCS
jgi:uncharacterized delta-60 repeat protein